MASAHNTSALRPIEDEDEIVQITPLAPAQPSLVGRRIGEIVVALGFASVADVAAAVEEARDSGKATGRVLFDKGVINKNQLAQAIAARTQISYIDLRNLEIEDRA